MKLYMAFLAVLIIPYLSLADTFTASSGNWNDASTWVRTNESGVGLGNVAATGTNPDAGDTILIPAGVTVDVLGGGNKTSITNLVVINVYGIIDFVTTSSALTLVNISSVIQIDEDGDIATSGNPSETLTFGSGGTKESITGPDLAGLASPNKVTFDTAVSNVGCAELMNCDDNPLPVELLFFSGFANNTQSVNLSWATSTEENFEYFEIAHSLDGKTFEVIGTVAGNGNTTTRHDYSFQDPAPYSGLNYYRLKSIDYDGYTELFPLVAVQLNNQLKPEIFPNPSTGTQLNFRGLDALNPFDIEIISLAGKSHLFKQAVMGNTINLNPSLSPGLYIINTTVGNQSFSQRLIIR